MYESFMELNKAGEPGGITAIRKVRDLDPATYIKVIAGMITRDVMSADSDSIMSALTVTFVQADAQQVIQIE